MMDTLQALLERIEQLKRQRDEMFAALLNVRALISEAAMTGFNCNDGDWAERLFASQAVTSAAIKTFGGETSVAEPPAVSLIADNRTAGSKP